MLRLLREHYRWHLAVLGEKESNLYLLNGLLLTFLFFSARVICYGAGLWHLWGLRWDPVIFPVRDGAKMLAATHAFQTHAETSSSGILHPASMPGIGVMLS